MVGDILWRAVAEHPFSVHDDIGSTLPARVSLQEWRVDAETPKGWWIIRPDYELTRKWVPRKTRFVSATPADALQCLLRRKLAHVRHATRRLAMAEAELRAVQAHMRVTT
jgi:hypothetical protein